MSGGRLPSGIRLTGTFWARDPVPDAPGLKALARVDPDQGRHDPTGRARAAVHVGFDRVDPDAFFAILRGLSVRLVRSFLHTSYGPEFWAPAPDDCVGAVLPSDGYVAPADPKDAWRIVPLSEPFAVRSRPTADTEGPGPAPHVLCAGGIPVVSDRLLATLRDLGAAGETADVVYRGHNRARADTVQPGYRRFLVRPEVDTGGNPAVDVLPDGLAEDFGVRSFRRSRGDDVWLQIALDRRSADRLRARRRTVLLRPVFRSGGLVARVLQAVDAGARGLGSAPVE